MPISAQEWRVHTGMNNAGKGAWLVTLQKKKLSHVIYHLKKKAPKMDESTTLQGMWFVFLATMMQSLLFRLYFMLLSILQLLVVTQDDMIAGKGSGRTLLSPNHEDSSWHPSLLVEVYLWLVGHSTVVIITAIAMAIILVSTVVVYSLIRARKKPYNSVVLHCHGKTVILSSISKDVRRVSTGRDICLRVVCASIVLIAVTAAVVISLLLLRAGDVETNPGPETGYDIMVRNAARFVMALSRDPETIANHLYSDGLIDTVTLEETLELNETKTSKARRLYTSVMGVVKAFPDRYKTFIAVFQQSPLLYGDLLESLDKDTAPPSPPVTQSSPDDQLSDDVLSIDKHLRKLKAALWEVRYKWKELGRELRLREGTIRSIHANDDGECLDMVLSQWIDTGKATVTDLIKALESPVIGRGDIAINVRQRFFKDDKKEDVSFSPDLSGTQDFGPHIKEAIKTHGLLVKKLAHCVFAGPPGTGKTWMMKRFLGDLEKLPDFKDSNSTGSAEKPMAVEIHKHTAKNVRAMVTLNESKSETTYIWKRLEQSVEATLLALQSRMVKQPPQKRHIDSSEQDNDGTSSPGAEAVDQSLEDPVDTLVEMMNDDHILAEELVKSISLYLTDTGGQIEFQELLPLLVSGPSVFLVVFRLDKGLDEPVHIKFRDSNNPDSFEYSSVIKSGESIVQTLDTIAAMYDKKPGKKPKVLLVGTYKDIFRDQVKRIDDMNKAIRTLVNETQAWKNGYIVEKCKSREETIFSVSNEVNEGKIDQEFEVIKSFILKYISPVPYAYNWFLFGFVLSCQKTETIPIDECWKLADKCKLRSKAEMVEALTFLHEDVGVIRYFNVGILKHIVFKTPQVLFKYVTEMILSTLPTSDAFQTFRNKGIFEEQHLTDFKLIQPELLIELLQHLHIVACFSSSLGRKFFMPSVVGYGTYSKEEESKVLATDLKYPPLLITFDSGSCPKGLLGALVVHLHEKIPNWSLCLKLVQKNCISLYFDTVQGRDTVLFRAGLKHIEVIYKPCSNDYRNCHLACNEIRKTVVDTINIVKVDPLPYRNLSIFTTLHCPKCTSESKKFSLPPEPVCPDKHGRPRKLFCEIHENQDLPPGYEIWYESKESAAAAVNPPENQADEGVVLEVNKHLHHVKNAVLDAAYLWFPIGQALNIPQGTLISMTNDIRLHNDRDRLNEVLSEWIHGGQAKIGKLFEALEDRSVKRHDIVLEIKAFKEEERRKVGLERSV